MVNAWSLLYDELYGDGKMTEKNESYDDFENPLPAQDTLDLGSISEFGAASVVGSGLLGGMCEDTISLIGDTISFDSDHMFNYHVSGMGGGDSQDTITFNAPTPSLDKSGRFKYHEDVSLKAARDYVTSTYKGHYTTKGSNTQTLDLIESVGDASSFCRSNALKYLSRYDKKGTPKNDILKAIHYCLLLFYFSGQTTPNNEPGYETF